ncbi:MAG: 2'-5' RNA ligase family protein [Janthinobacterium lividum]
MKIFNPVPFTKINSQNYLLVITPSEEITASICAFKDKAKELIGYFHSFNSKAQITVNHYYDKKALFMEEKLTYYDQKLQQEKPVQLKVCGFDYFEHQNTYTIYAKVDLNIEAEATFARFKKVLGSGVPNAPHITIARSLSEESFEKLWTYFEHLPFECFFYADKIVVLKTPTRRFHNALMEIETELRLKNAV